MHGFRTLGCGGPGPFGRHWQSRLRGRASSSSSASSGMGSYFDRVKARLRQIALASVWAFGCRPSHTRGAAPHHTYPAAAHPVFASHHASELPQCRGGRAWGRQLSHQAHSQPLGTCWRRLCKPIQVGWVSCSICLQYFPPRCPWVFSVSVLGRNRDITSIIAGTPHCKANTHVLYPNFR